MLKKVMSLLVALIIVLGCFSFVACGGGEENGTAKPSNGDKTTPAKEEQAPSNGGLTWTDMPIYSGAKQAQKGSWSIPVEEGEWSHVEWRYYETGDSADKVASFYKSQMPGKGWHEDMWMEAEGIAWAFYTKNNEADGAMFWVSSEEGETFFALMRATE